LQQITTAPRNYPHSSRHNAHPYQRASAKSSRNDILSANGGAGRDDNTSRSMALWIDELAAEFGLGLDDVTEAHKFSQLRVGEQLTMLYLQNIGKHKSMQDSLSRMDNLGAAIARMEELSQKSWKPSKAQEKLFKQLLRHYIIQPVSSYKQIPELAKDYIVKNATTLKLQIYGKNTLVTNTINKILTKECNELKSQFRKAVFQSTRDRVPLHDFTEHMVATWHMPTIPNPIPHSILATFALHRLIAGPLSRKRYIQGGNTGHWREIEIALDKAYDENGTKRGESPAWRAWQDDLIAGDNEICIYSPPDNPEEYPLEVGEEQDSADDGDIDIYQLGDMAAVA